MDMWKKEADKANRIRASLLLAIMVWIGGALVGHTLSDNHINHHIHGEDYAHSSLDKGCMLVAFLASPFATVDEVVLPLAICLGDVVVESHPTEVLLLGKESLPPLRAPPTC